MIKTLFEFAGEIAQKIPWKKIPWGKVFATAVTTAVVTVASTGSQKAIDKLFQDKKKSLKQKLDELKKVRDSRDITEEEYQKIRQALLDRSGKEG